MLKRNALLLSSALSVWLALPLSAQDTGTTEAQTDMPEVEMIELTGDTVIATVNGEDITMAHLVAARASLPEQFQQLPDDVLLPGIVEQLIQQAVLGQAMGELSNRAEIRLENQRRELAANEKVEEVISGAVTDEALQAAYDTEYANAEPTQEFSAAHILVETEDKAKELIEELDGGADFAELAKENSTGPSGPNGGDLGWFTAGMMVKPFEDAVMGLEAGAISAPVQTQFGWHVIKLNETRMKGAPTLDEVRDELSAKVENDAVEAALKALLDAAKIDRIALEGIDPAALRDMTLLDK
ncbi:peptidyl-prolyl cis-trans isomerase C [Aliiroseovarius sediminilitoris]|uniref:Parvulin-like PPIase n=1 Tax=Aliiroseovarius sediminilitoris TaxID=1173584 RepID=A0A1I0MRW2_9RHOB|nr:peptidylprolyl isomerase [Aliiroseovarius sediminilitoris]SEV90956.1 peptidyl-prolyl cis-trans isomerase C [Aliiroseovarius sediminilitoris]